MKYWHIELGNIYQYIYRLIPILADPLRFINKDDQDDYTDKNSIAFTLNAKCEKKPNAKSTDPIE